MKKLISICVALFLLTIGCTAFASDFDFTPKVPKLAFKELDILPVVNAGDTLSLTLNLQNISNNTASDVIITPSFENTPLIYEQPIIMTLEKSLRARQNIDVSFSFKVSDNARSGVYAIPFKLQYNNIRDEAYENTQNIYFKVDKENIAPLMTVNNVVTSSAIVSPNSQFTLSFDLNNIGDLAAKDMKVTLSGLNKDEFIVTDSQDLQYVGTLQGKESKTITYPLTASENLTDGSHSLTIRLEYTDSQGENVTEEKNIYITNVNSSLVEDDGTGAGTPKVMIASYSTNPANIKAGDSILFTFNFTNTNTAKTIRNMKITINSSEEGAFMIAKGSNTFYIESMGPKESLSKSIELNVKQDLASKSYPINIRFDYEDSKGTNYNSDEVINLPVTEYSKLVINSVYVSEAYVNGSTSLSFDYINMGKATVSNLTASVEGDYTSVQPINYIGNLTAGTSDYYDIEVTPTKEGENFGTLVLSFEDSSGKIIEVRKEFSGFAMAEFVPNDVPSGDDSYMDPMPIEPEVKNVNTWVIVGSGIGTFLVTFLIVKLIATKIFRKKLENEI